MVLGLLVGVSPAHAADPLRVLLTGDSITQGFHGDYTWRYRLAKEFARQGKAVDFVGSRSDPYVKAGWTSAQYADPNFDSDHFAVTGSTLGQLANWIGDELRVQRPDLVVLTGGINDLRGGSTAAQTDSHLRRWINEVRSEAPTLPIVVSPVLDAIDPGRPGLSDRINAYNALARDTVDKLAADGAPITMADTTRGWSAMSHTAENLHPTATGETLIAQRIAETLHQLNYLTQKPDIYRWTSWNRQPRVRVVVENQRAVLTWDYQALTGARVWIRRVGHAASFPLTRYAAGTMTTSPLVGRGQYEFRVQFIRGRMATPLGPITRITAPVPPRPAAVSRVVVDAARVHWTRSALATHYIVKFRRAKAKRWVTRTTTGLQLTAARVKRARVWAVNVGGRSAMRAGAR
jgi:lysophospholipase L1-like esterase